MLNNKTQSSMRNTRHFTGENNLNGGWTHKYGHPSTKLALSMQKGHCDKPEVGVAQCLSKCQINMTQVSYFIQITWTETKGNYPGESEKS